MPFGVCADYPPVVAPKDKPSTFEAKTQVGLVVGYHVQPGGKWSGDYLVVDLDLSHNPDLFPSSCWVHKRSEILNFRPKVLHFPLVDYRRKIERTVSSPERSGSKETTPSSSAAAPGQLDPDPPAAVPSPVPRERGPASVPEEGKDERGRGGKAGKRVVRKYSGSTRPPDVNPGALGADLHA